jgi:signal transduction histidine kinase
MPSKAKEEIFAGPSKTGALMRTIDWSRTPLGPVDEWPQSLRTSVSICLNSAFAILVWWGPELVMLYNDTYAPIISNKHPRALGACGREVFPEIWETIEPMLDGVMKRGEAVRADDLFLLLERDGYPEETYFTFSYSPILDETGGVGGIITPVHETTDRVLGERRLRTLTRLAAVRANRSETAIDACQALAHAMSDNRSDLPFVAIYIFDDSAESATRVAFSGADSEEIAPSRIDRNNESISFLDAVEGKVSYLEASSLPNVRMPRTETGRMVEQVLVVPIIHSKLGKPKGFMIAGANPHKRLDASYLSFLSLVADHVAASIADAESMEAQRNRVEALAELAELRDASEKALRINEARVREVLERTTDAVFTLNHGWEISYINANAVLLVARGRDLLGKNIWQAFPEAVGREFWNQYHKAMEEKLPVEFEEYYPDPINKWFEVHAYPTDEGIAVFFRDVTQRRKSDHALRQSEKLAAAGRLAASISHEINNPLESVTNLLYLIELEENLSPHVREYLRTAQAELTRVSHIATQTLRFYRQNTKATNVRIPEILDSVIALYQGRLRDSHIRVERKYRSSESLTAFAGELRQVFANLVGNAIDAITHDGRIVLRERLATDWSTGRSGIRVTVADNGIGMKQETLVRLFEAFFSTKGITGTGLGLWVSKEIVEKHSGTIAVRSSQREGHSGTVFSVFLPFDSALASNAA